PGDPVERPRTPLVGPRRPGGKGASRGLGDARLEYGAKKPLLWAQRMRWPPLRSQGSKQLPLPVVGRFPAVPRHAIRPRRLAPTVSRMAIAARDVTVTRGRRAQRMSCAVR